MPPPSTPTASHREAILASLRSNASKIAELTQACRVDPNVGDPRHVKELDDAFEILYRRQAYWEEDLVRAVAVSLSPCLLVSSCGCGCAVPSQWSSSGFGLLPGLRAATAGQPCFTARVRGRTLSVARCSAEFRWTLP
jgi:hypothetical protein